MKAKKFIEKTKEGEYEFIKNHVIDIEVDKSVIENVCGSYLDVGFDPEDDYNKFGVLTNEDGEPEYIKIGKFLDAIDKKAHDGEEALETDDYNEVQKLKEFRDYDLWM